MDNVGCVAHIEVSQIDVLFKNPDALGLFVSVTRLGNTSSISQCRTGWLQVQKTKQNKTKKDSIGVRESNAPHFERLR